LKLLLQVAPQLIVPGLLVMVPDPVPVVLTVRANAGTGENVAVAATAEEPIVKLHAPVPVHAPVHPAKTDPPPGVAVRVIGVPVAKLAEQVAPQLIPAGALLTEPVPVPANVTLIGKVVGMKFASTVWSLFRVTEHAPLPVHAPLHPAKVDPADAVGVSATTVPLLKLAEQVAPQLIPAGELETEPEPVPDVVTVRVAGGSGTGPKVAVTA
jgi:hypothetical protein